MLRVNVGVCVIIVMTVVGLSIGASINHPFRGKHALDYAPLIDGHNDLPFNLYKTLNNKLDSSLHVRPVDGQEDMKAKLAEAGDKLVVVDFFATWCGPCKEIAPQVELLAQESPNIVFLKVDVDEHVDLVDEYKITAVPTFFFFKNRQQVDSFLGASLAKLKKMIAKYQ